MRVGCVKEIKEYEYRVGLTPDNASQYVRHGHTVWIESGAGAGSGFEDADYQAAGAQVKPNAADIWSNCEMVVKVKEPLPSEYGMIRRGQIVFAYLHLASSKALTQALLDTGCIGVAYETVSENALLPLLKPMSEIAGRLSILEGAKYLQKPMGGKGLLLSGVAGTKRTHVVILGAGVVGSNACKIAVGIGARVTVLDIDIQKLTALDDLYYNRVTTLMSTPGTIDKLLPDADLVIGALLIPGAGTPKLIKRRHLKTMQPGSVIVDVAVDQGGSVETAHVTYHNDPAYVLDGVTHYCVGNMPGAVPVTSTLALTNATLRYGLMLADEGVANAVSKSDALAAGVNVWQGLCTCQAVAESLSLPYTPLPEALRV